MSKNVKDVTEEPDNLAHDALCLLEELYDLVVDVEDDRNYVPVAEAHKAVRAVKALRDAIGAWHSSLTSDEDEEPASAPASASP